MPTRIELHLHENRSLAALARALQEQGITLYATDDGRLAGVDDDLSGVDRAIALYSPRTEGNVLAFEAMRKARRERQRALPPTDPTFPGSAA